LIGSCKSRQSGQRISIDTAVEGLGRVGRLVEGDRRLQYKYSQGTANHGGGVFEMVGFRKIYSLKVQDALPEGTTFAEFVVNTRGFAAKDRAEALRIWLEQQVVGEEFGTFDGSKEELEVIAECMQGTAFVVRAGAHLTSSSVKLA
jgi:hypothetical protein